MTPELSDDLRQAIEESGGGPVYIVDAKTNASYVVIRAEQYQSLAALLADAEGFDPSELYPLIARSAAAAGWDDPEMDEYNDYDAHKKP
jgi:D-alanine-D-alanine ligase-like ATP-grasp enzyme